MHIRRAAAAVGLVVLAACGDAGSDSASSVPPPPDLGHSSTTSTSIDFGGLPLEVPDGFFAVPVPASGFGLALPDGFEASLLTPDAVAVLQAAEVGNDGFVSAALNASESGALFYAAGLTADGGVTDVKLDVQQTDDPDAVVLQVIEAVQREADLDDIAVETDAEAGIARIRFTTPGPDGSADRAQGTQFVYRAPDAVWSMIITSEDAENHDLVADAIGATFVLATSS
jgi:hypothetical protein